MELNDQDNYKRKVEELLDLVISYARLDFSKRVEVSETGNIIDNLSLGLNMLGEELKASTDSAALGEKRLSILMDILSNGVEDIDLDGKILFANKALHQMFEFDEGGLIGHSMLEFVPPPEKAGLKSYLEYLVKEQPLATPYTGEKITKKGKKITVQVTWNYRRDYKGNLLGFTSIIANITKMKKAEKDLRKKNLELEEKVRDLEDINELMVDREVKMVELKEEIKTLKKSS